MPHTVTVFFYTLSYRKQIFGANIIDVPVKSYLQLLFEEVDLFFLYFKYAVKLFFCYYGHYVMNK